VYYYQQDEKLERTAKTFPTVCKPMHKHQPRFQSPTAGLPAEASQMTQMEAQRSGKQSRFLSHRPERSSALAFAPPLAEFAKLGLGTSFKTYKISFC
jgi:hypothetical protein